MDIRFYLNKVQIRLRFTTVFTFSLFASAYKASKPTFELNVKLNVRTSVVFHPGFEHEVQFAREHPFAMLTAIICLLASYAIN